MEAGAGTASTHDSRMPEIAPRIEFAVLAALVVVCVLTYLPVLGTGLLSDDWGLSAAGTHPWVSWHGHWTSGAEGDFYRPLSRISLYYQARLFGQEGVGQHIVSLLLHCFSGVLLWLALRRAGRPLAGLVACGVALLHPAAAEAVGWVSSQTDLNFQVFLLASIALLLPVPDAKRTTASLLLALVAYTAKDTALLIGPAAFSALVYIWLFARMDHAQRRWWTIGLGSHVGLWIAYMVVRRAFLGKFLVTSTGDASLAEMSASLLAILDQMLWPIVQFAPERTSLRDGSSPLWLMFLFLPAVFALAAWTRRHGVAILVGLFALCSWPFLRAYEITLITDGMERYFYLPLFLFAAISGLLVDAPLARRIGRRATLGIGVILLLLVLRLSYLTDTQLDHFERAAAVRDQIGMELETTVFPAEKPAIILESMPDRALGAYVFRNGFFEYVAWKSGDQPAPTILDDEVTVASLAGHRSVFRLNYRGEGLTPLISLDEELGAIARGDVRASASPATPLILDMSIPEVQRIPFVLGEDLQVEGPDPNGGVRYRITGRDPHIYMPVPREFSPGGYGRAFIEFSLPGATGDGGTTESDFIFVSATPNAAPITQSKRAVVQEARQEVSFGLAENIRWQTAGAVRWMRFDPVSDYAGQTIIIHRMGLE